MRQRHYPVFRCNKIFALKIFVTLTYFGSAIVSILIPHQSQFISDDLHQPIWITLNLQILTDSIQNFQVFISNLVLFQPGQPMQT